jgi:hypothetical protein
MNEWPRRRASSWARVSTRRVRSVKRSNTVPSMALVTLIPPRVVRPDPPPCAYAATMANKQPRSSEKKKVGKNLKEKRAAKNEKKVASQSLGRTGDK